MRTNGTIHSGTVACSSSGVDLGLVMSTITKWDMPASSRIVSVKSFVAGLSKLNTIGTQPPVLGKARYGGITQQRLLGL